MSEGAEWFHKLLVDSTKQKKTSYFILYESRHLKGYEIQHIACCLFYTILLYRYRGYSVSYSPLVLFSQTNAKICPYCVYPLVFTLKYFLPLLSAILAPLEGVAMNNEYTVDRAANLWRISRALEAGITGLQIRISHVFCSKHGTDDLVCEKTPRTSGRGQIHDNNIFGEKLGVQKTVLRYPILPVVSSVLIYPVLLLSPCGLVEYGCGSAANRLFLSEFEFVHDAVPRGAQGI